MLPRLRAIVQKAHHAWLVLPLAAAVFGCNRGARASATDEGDAPGRPGTAVLVGRVLFPGTPPPPVRVKVGADPACSAQRPQGLESRRVAVEDGGLADVLVYVKHVPGRWAPPAEPVTIEQRGCDYLPHVVALQAGQPLRVVNDDPTFHNVHPLPSVNDEWNLPQARKGDVLTRTFASQEILFPLGCNVHPWMRGFISVVAHPFFAVSGRDGRFRIERLPAGEYEVQAAHELLKTRDRTITVKDGETATLDFTFEG